MRNDVLVGHGEIVVHGGMPRVRGCHVTVVERVFLVVRQADVFGLPLESRELREQALEKREGRLRVRHHLLFQHRADPCQGPPGRGAS